jgi:hypothetical protein
VDRPEPSSNQVRTINLALQGGGAHGAFTWGWLAKRQGRRADRQCADRRAPCDSQSRHQSAVEAAILEAAGQNTACGGAGHNKGLKHSFVCYLLVNEAVWIHTRHHQDVAAGIVSL